MPKTPTERRHATFAKRDFAGNGAALRLDISRMFGAPPAFG